MDEKSEAPITEEVIRVFGILMRKSMIQVLLGCLLAVLVFVAAIQSMLVYKTLDISSLPLFTPLFWTIFGLGLGINSMSARPPSAYKSGSTSETFCYQKPISVVAAPKAPKLPNTVKTAVAVDLGDNNSPKDVTEVNIDEEELEKYKAEDTLAKTGEKREELLNLLKDKLKRDQKNIQLLWRAARAAYNLSKVPNITKKKQKEWTYIAYDYANNAILNGGQKISSKCNVWYGIMLNAIGTFEGTKQMVNNLLTVKEYWIRANALSKTDSSPPHLLGRWCKGILETTWWEKKAVSAIFGGEMPQTSWEEALSFFEEADKRHTKLVASGKETYWITNTKCLGECLIKVGRKQDAKTLFLQTVDVEAISEEDKESKVIIAKLLKTM